MSVKQRRVQIKPQIDVTLDVIINGVDGHPPIVLLPSSQRGSIEFDAVAQQLAGANYLVLRPQPRGIGASIGPLENLTLHILAADVAATIRELGGGHRAIIIGHAYGHFVARVTDLDYPELVRGIVLAACSQRNNVDPSLNISLDQAANYNLTQDERLFHLRRAFFAKNSDATVWLTGWHSELREFYRKASKYPPKDEWWLVSHSPILDLQAAEDPWRQHGTRYELQEVLGKDFVTVCVIDAASHALFPEQPEKVVNAIIDWAKSLKSN